MVGTIASRTAFKALAQGVRLRHSQRIIDFIRNGRTIDEIKRLDINLVLDVGANRGFYAKHLRMLGYKGFIVSFEPDPGTYTYLAKAAEGDDKWLTRNVALGSAVGFLDFNVIVSEGGTDLSSVHAMVGLAPAKVIKVSVDTVANVLRSDELPVSRNVFLKMDTQGFDLEVFTGADLSDVKLLQSKVSVVPLYNNMPHYTDALRLYHDAGFSLLDLFVVGRTPEGGVLEYDALMVKA